MASSSFRPNRFDLNVVLKITHDAKVWCLSLLSQNRHLTINDSVMMNDTTAVIVARNFLTPMDEILLTGRANEIQELNTENSSLQRMLHESQQEVEKLMLCRNWQISNEKFMADHKRLMAKLKRRCPLLSEVSKT